MTPGAFFYSAMRELAERLVGDGRAVPRHAVEVLLGLLDALLDGHRDFVGLAVADPDDLTLVADHHQRREGEPATTLDDLRHAVDLDDPLLKVHPAGGDCAIT